MARGITRFACSATERIVRGRGSDEWKGGEGLKERGGIDRWSGEFCSPGKTGIFPPRRRSYINVMGSGNGGGHGRALMPILILSSWKSRAHDHPPSICASGEHNPYVNTIFVVYFRHRSDDVSDVGTRHQGRAPEREKKRHTKPLPPTLLPHRCLRRDL